MSWATGTLGAALLAAQLVRPALPIGPAGPALDVPPDVDAFLRQSCFDCHSNETRLPWFDRIVPAYWLVVADVRRGRAALSFSELATRPLAAQHGALFEAVNHVRLGAMPPWRYTVVHRDAVPAAAQIDAMVRWLRSVAPAPARAAAETPPAPSPASVRPAPNGLAFRPDYRDWRVVSNTERFDNASLRQILGNDVAIRAIEQGTFPPWPDGAMFAKVAWQQVVGDDGVVRAGPFVQVELMVKDAARYADTDGWGWARWRGADLQPYGADATFTKECVGCHAPMRDADYVYTLPIDRSGEGGPARNDLAVVRGALSTDPLQWRVVASSVDSAGGTMSTLFGDDVAIDAARARQPYSPAAALALVTWQRQDDVNWFGARIPGRVSAVEVVRGDTYERYEGSPLRALPTDPASADARRRLIVDQPASHVP